MPVLAEPRARDRQRGEIRMRARHVDRKAERDRRRARVFLEDLDFDARRRRAVDRRRAARPDRPAARRAAPGASRISSSGASPLTPIVRFARVYICRANCLHVVQRDGVDARDRAERDVPVRRAAEDVRLQPLLAELLLVVRAQILHERVQLRVLDALEVLRRASPGRAAAAATMPRNFCQWSRWMTPVNVVISLSVRPRTSRPSDTARHRSASMVMRLRAGLASSSPRSSAARPSLPGGIVGGADGEQQLHVELRQQRLLQRRAAARLAAPVLRRRGRGRRRRGAAGERPARRATRAPARARCRPAAGRSTAS